MDEIYYNPRNSGSFGGRDKLIAAHKKQYNLKLKKSDAERFLSGQDSYTLHKPRKIKFKRNKYILSGIDDVWQADLADMTSLSGSNNGIKYILFVIDCFSKFLWTRPLKAKTATHTLHAIKDILAASRRKPKNMMTDNGGEFRNYPLKKYLTSIDINFYTTRNAETKAAIVERCIRTVKSRIFRYLTYKNSWHYADVLNDFTASYNSSYHRTIKTSPDKVSKQNELSILKLMYPDKNAKYPVFKFAINDSVRVKLEQTAFQKGYAKGWSEEIFKVVEIIERDPVVYRVKDYGGETISGTFYEPELQKVLKKDDLYKVEKVLKRRKVRGKTEYLIKWLGYPRSMATWEPEDHIQDPKESDKNPQ